MRNPYPPIRRAFRRLAESRRWALWLSLAVTLAILAAVTLMELGGVLRGMHLQDQASRSLEGGLTGSADEALESVTAWRQYSALVTPVGFTSARTVAAIHLLVDTLLFVPAYTLALALLLLREGTRRGLADATTTRRVRKAWRQDAEVEPTAVRAEAEDVWANVLHSAFYAVLALALLDWLENGLLWVLLDHYWEAVPLTPSASAELLVPVVTVVTIAKWLLALGLLGLVAITALQYVAFRRAQLWASVRLAALQIVLVVGFAVIVLFPVQMPDVLLRQTFLQFLLTAVLAVAFGLVLWAFARRNAVRATWRVGRPVELSPFPLQPVVVGILASLVLALVIWLTGGSFWPAAIPAGLAVGVFLLGVPVRRAPDEPRSPPEPGGGGDLLPRILGGLPAFALGLAVVKASVPHAVYSGDSAEVPRVLWGAGGALLGFAILRVLSGADAAVRWEISRGWWRGALRTIAIVTGTAAAILWIAIVLAPWTVAPFVSAVGVLTAFFLALALGTGTLAVMAAVVSERYRLPAAFRAVGFERFPVLTLLVVWAVLATVLGPADHFAIRVRDDARVAALPLRLGSAFAGWVETNEADRADGRQRRAVPLFLIGAAGGGIRAATWTALVMDCLFETRPVEAPACGVEGGEQPAPAAVAGSRANRVFLGSGISGGSLGLVEYVAYLNQGLEGEPRAEDWIRAYLADDYLSAAIGWGLFVEVPRTFLGFRSMDRAEVMERAWERSWGAEGPDSPLGESFLSMQLDPRRATLPLVMLNGASTLDGCALNASAFDIGADERRVIGRGPEQLTLVGGCQSLRPFETGVNPDVPPPVLPGTVDLVDFLCEDQDIALSTAALLSARFPAASPTGRVDACERESKAGAVFVVDGGYVEPSGAEQLIALWPRLEELVDRHNAQPGNACILPVFVQIDNGYVRAPGVPKTARPNELLAPLTAAQAGGRGSRAERARIAAALEFGRPYPGVEFFLDGTRVLDRFAQIVPVSHPGVEAPLGWSLSPASRQDLRDQLKERENQQDIAQIRALLSGRLTCEFSG